MPLRIACPVSYPSPPYDRLPLKGTGAIHVEGAALILARNVALIAKGDDASFQNKVHLFMEAAGFAEVKKVGEK